LKYLEEFRRYEREARGTGEVCGNERRLL